ncbi:MAG: T9SS type A sorting domain-containing protein [Bacteroidota bacterium]
MRIVFLLLFMASAGFPAFAQNVCSLTNTIPFKTDSSHILVSTGEKYVPLFIKGINLGIAVPGTQPGELKASRAQYARWLKKIKEAGFNTLRLYTLHYPHFYEVLDSMNKATPHNPLLIFQGVWLEEELPGYTHDIYQLTASFTQEIEDNVNCIHGKKTIPHRFGKAYGNYATDVSKWVIAYITGREVYSEEVTNANKSHATNTSYAGTHLSLSSGSPAEVWMTARLDHLVDYEQTHYQTQRPVSFSSWPTLDPITHPEETNRGEDTVSISLNKMDISKAPAGFFISYHAYPYYPDFISNESKYQAFSDNLGQNSYLGYLTDLKKHYNRFPVIIAEYGVPSSWGIAHYSSNGMHHGGLDEREQGEYALRMLKNIESAGCGGGMQFSWMDEWFKYTWITNPIDYIVDRRILWHNVMAAEQNFGLIGFKRVQSLKPWATYCATCPIKSVKAGADYDFLRLRLDLGNVLSLPDTVWIGLDTYASTLGESVLPNGKLVDNRAEFALRITNYSAELFVTEAYDLFGEAASQKRRSVVSNGGKWNIMRWRSNRNYSDVQYIGNLQVNKGGLLPSTKDAVTIYDDHLDIRLPWSLLQMVDPSQLRVLHDYKNTPAPEDTLSDGIAITVFHNGFKAAPTTRFTWPNWNSVSEAEEYEKISYKMIKERLPEFNNPAIARCDSYEGAQVLQVSAQAGVLQNDFDLDGNVLEAVLIESPLYGQINLNQDGSFAYTANVATASSDQFTYAIYDGHSLSEPATVHLQLTNFVTGMDEPTNHTTSNLLVLVYPNPALHTFTLESSQKMTDISLFNTQGEQVLHRDLNSQKINLDISSLSNGLYFVKATVGNQSVIKKLSVMH